MVSHLLLTNLAGFVSSQTACLVNMVQYKIHLPSKLIWIFYLSKSYIWYWNK